jgi:hypothetical protein
MFDAARSAGLRRPSIRLNTGSGAALRLSPAPASGRNSGSIYVTDANRNYLGRITDGAFIASRDTGVARPAGLTDTLRALAERPLETARAYGHATGNCCFCGRGLTDARSVAMGYGPVCAERYGLAWGEQRAVQHVDVTAADLHAAEIEREADAERQAAIARRSGFVWDERTRRYVVPARPLMERAVDVLARGAAVEPVAAGEDQWVDE